MSLYPTLLKTVHILNSGTSNSTLDPGVSWYGIERHYWAWGGII